MPNLRFADIGRNGSLAGLLSLAVAGCGDDDGDAAGTTSTGGGALTFISESIDGGGPDLLCLPGEIQCGGQDIIQTCAASGMEWLDEPCGSNEVCVPCNPNDACSVDRCEGPCASSVDLPSSAGCSFIANRQLHNWSEDEDGGLVPDGLVFANPNDDLTATVTIWQIPEGKNTEELYVDPDDASAVPNPVVLGPGEQAVVELKTDFVAGIDSRFRTGGMFRLDSDAPIVAYLHSPLRLSRGNDSSLLLPDSALGRDYVVVSYNPSGRGDSGGRGDPSYFEIIAIEPDTLVQWTPPVSTQGDGVPIDFVAAGSTGEITMQRFDTMRITPSEMDNEVILDRDLSGTVIKASKPVWIVSGTRCSPVPRVEFEDWGSPALPSCDQLQEVLLPLEHWGEQYVATALPVRNTEHQHWRIYSGADSVTVTSDPELDGFPHTFEQRGDFFETSVPPGTNFVVEGDGPFMPVGYLQSRTVTGDPLAPVGDAAFGDPAMFQMVPTAQFLTRYVFATGIGYFRNYVTVVRTTGNAEVLVDGVEVEGFNAVGLFQVATVEVSEGSHIIESDDEFGIIQSGFPIEQVSGQPQVPDENCVYPNDPCNSSYAYPGGMKSEVIFIP